LAKKIFLFFKNNFKELILVILFLIKAILNPFSATFNVKSAGNISA